MNHPQKVSFGEALFSGTRQKVLGLLFGQPDESFLLSEIIQRANAGSGAVQREVERLQASGLVTIAQLGRQKSYQANKAAPIYGELCALIRKTLGPGEQLKSLLANQSDITLAILYGSVAKQADTASSDIDLLLVSDTLTLEEIFSILEPLESELGRPIHPTLYTSTEFAARRESENPFLSKLLAGEHQLLKGGLSGQDAPG